MSGTYKNSMCIFCCKPASPSTLSLVEGEKDGNFLSKFIQFFKRYLKILPHQGSDYEIGTCDKCQQFGESFSELFVQWDSLRLKLDWKVSQMFEMMKEAGVSERNEAFETQFRGGGDDDNVLKLYGDVKKLRNELLLGCKQKLSVSTPKTVLKRIPEVNSGGVGGIARNASQKCTKVVQTGVAPLKKSQLRKRLMTFIAILHLSLPFHSPKSQLQSEQVTQSDLSLKKKKYWRVDKSVQTCPPQENHTENEDQAQCQDPSEAPILTLEEEAVEENLPPISIPPPLPTFAKCLICQSKFKSSLHLRFHMGSAHKTRITKRQRLRKLFKCENCNSVFETRAKLHTHTFHMHEKANAQKRKLKPTKNPNVREVLLCPLCPTRCKSQEDLSIHARLEHQRILAYECARCATKLKTVEGVRSHMKFFHGKTFKSVKKLMTANNVNYGFVGSTREKTEIERKNRLDSNSNPFQSHHEEEEVATANSPVRNEPQLISSQVSIPIFNEKQKNTIPNQLPSTSTSARPPESDTLQLVSSLIQNYKLPNILTKNFKCDFEGCIRKFSTQSQLHGHQRIHKPPKSLSLACLFPGCSSKFTSRLNQRKHFFLKHAIETLPVASPFRCEICPTSFPTAASLAQHLGSHDDSDALAVKRNGRAPFRFKRDKATGLIQEIKDSFIQKEQKERETCAKIIPVITLDSESTKETEVPNQKKDTFKCPECPASFKVADLFSSHLKREHNQEPILKFGCTPCGKEFDTSKEFVFHMFKVHEKVLEIRDENLYDRSKSQAGKKAWKYVCPEVGCEVTCSSKEELTEHLKSHAVQMSSEPLDLTKH